MSHFYPVASLLLFGKNVANCHFSSYSFCLLSVVSILQGLFRKVLFAELTPYRLVRLSNESLGSRELARWHEPEPQVRHH